MWKILAALALLVCACAHWVEADGYQPTSSSLLRQARAAQPIKSSHKEKKTKAESARDLNLNDDLEDETEEDSERTEEEEASNAHAQESDEEDETRGLLDIFKKLFEKLLPALKTLMGFALEKFKPLVVNGMMQHLGMKEDDAKDLFDSLAKGTGITEMLKQDKNLKPEQAKEIEDAFNKVDKELEKLKNSSPEEKLELLKNEVSTVEVELNLPEGEVMKALKVPFEEAKFAAAELNVEDDDEKKAGDNVVNVVKAAAALKICEKLNEKKTREANVKRRNALIKAVRAEKKREAEKKRQASASQKKHVVH